MKFIKLPLSSVLLVCGISAYAATAAPADTASTNPTTSSSSPTNLKTYPPGIYRTCFFPDHIQDKQTSKQACEAYCKQEPHPNYTYEYHPNTQYCLCCGLQ